MREYNSFLTHATGYPSGRTQNSGAAEFVTFDNLLRESDFVIACCSMNEENKGLFNKVAFAKMKSNAIFSFKT
jgi:glyoxylate/hydroxypyruvate reductase